MPANLTPEYFKAERWYREAVSSDEKILALERMLAVMPKHKGTDHLKADLRRKLSQLKEAATKKKGGKQQDVFHVPRGGSGQITLIGTPNSGKSAIVAALTNAKANVAEFPFATSGPVPGMMMFEDVHIQLIDLPPVTADFISPGQVGTYRNCDLIAMVIDLANGPVEQLKVLVDFLEGRSLLMDEDTPAVDEHGNLLGKRVLVICTKADLASDGAFEKFRDKWVKRFEAVKVSVETGKGMEKLPGVLFKQLSIIRVYAKPPGKKPDMAEPFTLPAGSTVMDLANAIHRELAEKLRFARIWGTGVYDGQNANRNHILCDKDIIELHFS